MPESLVPASPSRPSAFRALLALVVSLALVAAGLAYHDGVFATDRIADASEEAAYRFKGQVTAIDEAEGTLVLSDASGSATLAWNATRPRVGSIVVVDAERDARGSLQALAVYDVLVFRSV